VAQIAILHGMSSPDQLGDATRRTWLASERTWLAWVRTGLTSTAVAVGIGRIAPELSHVPRWPYAVIGAGYAILGVALVWYGFVRRREVAAAVQRGEYAPPGERVMAAFVALATVLGIGTGLVVLIS
jgi:putative membrane protein